ncbi:MAG: HNH endonuclease, partial [Acidimicrobiales bacterium]
PASPPSTSLTARPVPTGSVAQHLVRDGGHCRFPGCQRTIADLHHQHHWNHGGPTDLDNAFLACPHHHTLLHHGYHAC